MSTGPTGANGGLGPTGPQGIQGSQGIPGPQGSQGIQGEQGPRGFKGQEGPTGAAGVNAVAFATTAPLGLSAVPVLAGSVSLVVGTGLPYTLGNSVKVTNTASPLLYSFEGRVDAYNSSTGSMTVDQIANVLGNWSTVYTSSVSMNLDGVDGPTGQAGQTGSTGPYGYTGPTGPNILNLNDTFTGIVQFIQDISVNGVNVGRGVPNDLKSTVLGHNAYFSGTTGGIDWSYVNTDPPGPYTQNVAVGYQSMYCNTTGYSNTAVGINSLLLNTTGERNVAIGREAMLSNRTGGQNFAAGSQALWNNTTGWDNIAIGLGSMFTNTTGNSNIAIGSYVLTYGAPSVSNNVGIGYSALAYSAANNNTACGFESLYRTTTGTNNAAYGMRSAAYNTTGSSNVAVGYQSANSLTIGSNNTLVGASTNCPATSTQSTALGYGATITTNNQIVLGTATEYTYIPGNTASTSTTTGALVVVGGAGIGGRLNVGGAVAGATGSFTYLNATLGVNATLPVTSDASYNTVVRNPTTSQLYYHATKTFVIDHPTDENKYLVHACLEGPEAGVYYRGKAEITNGSFVEISLPPYADKVATDFTVQLTSVHNGEIMSPLEFSEVEEGKFTVYGSNRKFHWTVMGTRLPIEVEPEKSTRTLRGDGPYTYLS